MRTPFFNYTHLINMNFLIILYMCFNIFNVSSIRVGYQKKNIFYNVPLSSGFTNYNLFFSSMKRNRYATINNWSKMLTNRTSSKDSQKEVQIPIILKLDKEFYDMLNISRIAKKYRSVFLKFFFYVSYFFLLFYIYRYFCLI